MLLEWNLTLNKNVLVQIWESAQSVKEVTQKGYQVPTP
jgi:hypothetical protein